MAEERRRAEQHCCAAIGVHEGGGLGPWAWLNSGGLQLLTDGTSYASKRSLGAAGACTAPKTAAQAHLPGSNQ